MLFCSCIVKQLGRNEKKTKQNKKKTKQNNRKKKTKEKKGKEKKEVVYVQLKRFNFWLFLCRNQILNFCGQITMFQTSTTEMTIFQLSQYELIPIIGLYTSIIFIKSESFFYVFWQ